MPKRQNPAALGMFGAIGNALIGRPMDFYPRIKEASGKIETLPTDELLIQFSAASANWKQIPADKDLDAAIGLARQSLNEVKAQTEYQDQKAGRLLTVATILSALSGLLFTRFNDAFPVKTVLVLDVTARLLVALTYFAFMLFVFAVLCGALVTFHATRTRFKYDVDESPAKDEPPKSRLFYDPILAATPAAWAESFVAKKQNGAAETPIVNPELSSLYYRDLVGETYLVAAKAADKIRYLEEAQRLFAWALLFLLGWLVLLVAVSLLVEAPPAEVKPTIVKLIDQPSAVPVLISISQSKPLEVTATVQQPGRGGPKGQSNAPPGGKGPHQ